MATPCPSPFLQNGFQYPNDYFIDDSQTIEESIRNLVKYLDFIPSEMKIEDGLSIHDSFLHVSKEHKTDSDFGLNSIGFNAVYSDSNPHKRVIQSNINNTFTLPKRVLKKDLEIGIKKNDGSKADSAERMNKNMHDFGKEYAEKKISDNIEFNIEGHINEEEIRRNTSKAHSIFHSMNFINIQPTKKNISNERESNPIIKETRRKVDDDINDLNEERKQVEARKSQYNKTLEQVLVLLKEWYYLWGKSKMINGKLSDRNMKSDKAAAKVSASKKTLDYYQSDLKKAVYCKEKIDIKNYLHKSFGELHQAINQALPKMEKNSVERKKLKRALRTKEIKKGLLDLINNF